MKGTPGFVTTTGAVQISGLSPWWLKSRLDLGSIEGHRDERGRRVFNIVSLKEYMRTRKHAAKRRRKS